jgi:hypothetical protein
VDIRPKINIEYPKYNYKIFEEFFYEFYTLNNIQTKLEYLPIFWTAFYVNRNFGNGDISDLQNYINHLDRSKKYFTLVQYDDGILNNISNLDLYVFSLAQNKIYDFILPTTCLPRPNINKNRDRDIFCSFFGRYKGTYDHPTQQRIMDILPKNKYVVGRNIDSSSYYDHLERSKFFLCANGRSPTTFKICECLQSGTIPVFIYDEKWIPFEKEIEFEKACILIHESNIDQIDNILSKISDDKIQEMRSHGDYIYQNYYEYNSLSKKIITIINGL